MRRWVGEISPTVVLRLTTYRNRHAMLWACSGVTWNPACSVPVSSSAIDLRFLGTNVYLWLRKRNCIRRCLANRLSQTVFRKPSFANRLAEQWYLNVRLRTEHPPSDISGRDPRWGVSQALWLA